MDVRRRIPDAPSVMSAPAGFTLSSSNTGGSLPAGTYYVIASVVGAYGETLPTIEQSVSVSGGASTITISTTSSQLPFGAMFLRAYVGLASGNESGFAQIAVTVGTPASLVISALTQLSPGVPPSRSTAFLPDSDGNFISAGSIYSMLNRAATEMVRIAGGIVDVTGVQAQNLQSMYRLASPFYQFTNGWFDGYPLEVVTRNQMFLRNPASGFSGLLSYEQDGAQSTIQVWPQSNRTGGTSILTSAMSATDNNFTVSDSSGFLQIGLAQIDNEVVVFSSVSTNTFNGVLRGMGGTDAVAHSINAPVTELNLRFSGRRMARTYSPGDSAMTLNVPQGWEAVLPLYMLSQIRSMEQQDDVAEKLLSDFQAQADKIGKQSRLGQIRPRQIPLAGVNQQQAYNLNGAGFGWLLG